jgi:hypothetical protein
MPKGRELKKLVGPLLKRRPDLAYDQRMVFFVPLTHYLCGAHFISGFHGQYFQITALVDQLFDGADLPLLNRTSHNRALEKRVEETWLEDRDQASIDVSNIIEQHLLPPVAGVASPADHLDLPTFPLVGSWALTERAFGACFYGDFDAAQEWADKSLEEDLEFDMRFYKKKHIDLPDEELKFHSSDVARVLYLSRLLKRDRSAVIPLLHEWEAYKVRKLKLEKYWTPTPFPCET